MRTTIPFSRNARKKYHHDFRQTILWRIFRIMSEFVDGFGFIVDFHNTVSVFGSTRAKEGDRWYDEARELGRMLAKKGFTMITGGGPGIMEAANRGASEAGGESVGLNIQLPYEQRINPYVKKILSFHYFFTRKVMLTYAAEAYVFFPGGFGTLDEFMELVTLIQTKKIRRVPIIAVGKEYWQQMLDWFQQELNLEKHYIGPQDASIYQLVDSAKEAVALIEKSITRRELAQEWDGK